MTTPGTADEFSLLDEEAAAFAIAVPARPTVGRRTVAGSDGRTLSALVWGDGVPQLALLHGGGLNARNGRALPQPRRRRRPRRPCRRPRHPGLEDSPMKPPFPYYGGKTRQAQWITGLLPRDYTHEMTDDDHRELAAVLHASPATVVLSGYDSDLYRELYGGWWMTVKSAPVYSGTWNGSARTAVEVLWSNRPLEGRLFDVGASA